MRIRTIKPEYWQHAMHEMLSKDASILGAAIQNFADDEGRGDATPTKIQGLVVPAIVMNVEAVLKELEAIDFLILYEVTVDKVKRRLFQVVTFARHQSINKWTPSVLPHPPGWMFRLDAKPEKWDDKKATWRRGKWYRADDDPAQLRLPVGQTPGGLRESAGSESGDGAGVSPATVEEHVRGERGTVSSLARAQKGKGKGSTEGKETEGEGALAVRASSPDGPRAPSRRFASDASIPTVEEVAAFGASLIPTPAPRDYAEDFHAHWSADREWLKNGQLRDWQHHFRNWWATDTLIWQGCAHRWQRARGSCPDGAQNLKSGPGGPPKGGTTYGHIAPWKELQILEDEISKHPANRESRFHDKNAGEELKADLKRKRARLAELRQVSRGDAESAERRAA